MMHQYNTTKLLQWADVGTFSTFNIHTGFEEALLRGFKLGFISDIEYHHIKQCDSLEDVKLNLQETDYGSLLQNEGKLTASLIREKCLDKLVAEFTYLRANAVQPLAQFLDFISYDYMIDNVMLLLKATLHNPNCDISALLAQTHPLGRFKSSTLKSILAFDNSAKGYQDLYQTVLIDTPIGPYFRLALGDTLANISNSSDAATETLNSLKELPATKLEALLRKYYLEHFHQFCNALGGETATYMCQLLKFRGDILAINVTLNSFGTELNDPSKRLSDRKALYPSVGMLYPEGLDSIANVGDENELAIGLRAFNVYSDLLDKHVQGVKSIDDAFYEREAMLNEIAFEGQFNYAGFYAFVRLKEQEIRNLVWICECIVQKQKDRVQDHFVPLFSKDATFRSNSK